MNVEVVLNWLLVFVSGMVGMVKVVFNMLFVYFEYVGCLGFVNMLIVQVLCVFGDVVGLVFGL